MRRNHSAQHRGRLVASAAILVRIVVGPVAAAISLLAAEGRVTHQAAHGNLPASAALSSAADTHPTDTALRIAIAGAPFRGRADAPVVIVEFSDLDCSFCRRHARQTFPRLDAEYISVGKIKYVFKHFPLPHHRSAMSAHEAAACAADQGRFWEMHSELFGSSGGRTADALAVIAQTAGVRPEPFRLCMAKGTHGDTIRKDVTEGRAIVKGTPAFFIGFGRRDSAEVIVKATLTGAKPYPVFQQILDRLLKAEGRTPPAHP